MVGDKTKMKGIILAGGKGTRLWPITAATNKHLVPVGNLPMIEYPLATLSQIGVDSISVVTGGEHFQDVARYLSEVHPKIKFSYHAQREAGGIAQALSLAEQFVKDSRIAVILGDNVFEDDFSKASEYFQASGHGAMVFLKRVSDPKRFGVAEIRAGKLIGIEEKPKNPKTDLAVTGLYFYDSSVFQRIKNLKPSARGELEVTDLNKSYLEDRKLGYEMVAGFWSDAGTYESREVCEKFVGDGLETKVARRFEISLGNPR
jgi:glucose-1-phosphate thymidylyltransferase